MELFEGVDLEAGDGVGSKVGGEGYLERDLTGGEFGDESRVSDGADAVADAVGIEGEGVADV